MVNIFFVKKMCIYSCAIVITQSTTVLITRGPAQWRGQLVMHHFYIMYFHFPKIEVHDVNMMHPSIIGLHRVSHA